MRCWVAAAVRTRWGADEGEAVHGDRYEEWHDPVTVRKVHISVVFPGAEGLGGSALLHLRKIQSTPGLVVHNVSLRQPENNEQGNEE